jgi:SAM-dependent methyltransferase
VKGLLRRARWVWHGWSKAGDQRFHDELYARQDYDPFCESYPGYITIRRFAELAEPFLPASGVVLDVGCGPGEITCELARRHAHLEFVGVDHSAEAVRRATQHGERLELANVRFRSGDAESLGPDGRFGLVTLFDSFHHFPDPDRFIRWLGAHTNRCLLVEPRGSSSGGWQKDIDVDWLLHDLASIHDRVSALAGLPALRDVRTRPNDDVPAPADGSAAVERRYALADYQRWFAGWTLYVRGTVAGFESYPPLADADSPLRRAFGNVGLDLVRLVDEALLASGRDLLAKHLLIVAGREDSAVQVRDVSSPAIVAARAETPRVASPFDVRYRDYVGPATLAPGEEALASIEIENCGWDVWSTTGDVPVYLSYHWLDRSRCIEVFDGARTPLPRALGPGERCRAAMRLRAPERPGRFLLAIDCVREHVSWFSQAGQPWHEVGVRVRSPT